MVNKMFKNASLLLALVMLAAAFTGCGNKEAKSSDNAAMMRRREK